jgi:hypothetical protein
MPHDPEDCVRILHFIGVCSKGMAESEAHRRPDLHVSRKASWS